jgi:hypothetical protein
MSEHQFDNIAEAQRAPLKRKTPLRAKKWPKWKRHTEHDWESMIEQVAEREHCRCQCCGTKLETITPANIHHFLPRSQSGSDDQKNLILLCSTFQGDNCHSRVHNNPSWAKEKGFLAPSGYKEQECLD